MTQLLDRIDDTGPSNTTVSEEGLFALRTRRHRPEQRLAQRLLAPLDGLTDTLEETLTSNVASYEELRGASPALPPSKYVTTASATSHRVSPEQVLPDPGRRALHALNVLILDLEISETEAATLAGISRNTVRGWKEGRAPYPATTRRLFQLANLFEAIKRSGTGVAEWIEQASPTGGTRREFLRVDDGPALLAREAAPLLFGSPSLRTLATDLPTEDDVEEVSNGFELEETRFSFTATRGRRRKR